MKWLTALVLALCGLAFFAQGAEAAVNGVSFDRGQPSSPAAGKVLGTGSYTEDPAYLLSSITLIATNPNGGPGGGVTCMLDRMTMTWSGTIAGLPTGTYNVFARGIFNKVGAPGSQTVDTATVQVVVP